MLTYDDAAFERFCGDLVNLGFSPVRGSDRRRWTGPVRSTLEPLTAARRMQVYLPDGWPLQYARVVVDGMSVEHAANGTICLWADDDPAQVDGVDLQALLARLDEWAARAERGFQVEDRALDAYLLYAKRGPHRSELPLGDLLKGGGNGFRAQVHAIKKQSQALFIAQGEEPATVPQGGIVLKGAFYQRRDIGAAPRSLNDVKAALTRRQLADLERGLASRSATAVAEPSGGYDFIVLAWPRHDQHHDAVVIYFSGQADSLDSFAIRATPNDVDARKRRAGPDATAFDGKTVVIAGAGSVGGHVAVALASSGVTAIRLFDGDDLTTGNVVRHVCPDVYVGYRKTTGVSVVAEEHAPWTEFTCDGDLPHDSQELVNRIGDADLVIDCTGLFSLTAALAFVCHEQRIPFITGALFHQGSLARIRRQADADTPIAARNGDPAYPDLPPDDPSAPTHGFLELGCLAPINNASPVAVLTTAADIAHAAVDFLTGRRERPDERVLVFRRMNPPFDRIGTHDVFAPARSRGSDGGSDSAE